MTPAAALLVAGLALAFAPGIAGHARQVAARAIDRPAYAAEVLHGELPAPPPAVPSWHAFTAADWAYGAASTAGAVSLALLLLYRRRLPELVRPPIAVLRAVHSGVIGDYATWVAVGTVVFAAVWGATLR